MINYGKCIVQQQEQPGENCTITVQIYNGKTFISRKHIGNTGYNISFTIQHI